MLMSDTVILVCGAREWRDLPAIYRVLQAFDAATTIVVHGACRGADLMAEECARRLEMRYRGYPARWRAHGKGAGPIRNGQMLASEPISRVLAFHQNLRDSKGTRDMVTRAVRADIPVDIYPAQEFVIVNRMLQFPPLPAEGGSDQ
jgi:hypothetical protein